LEDIISSKGRFKILELLATVRELNISEIARKTNTAYISTNRHLKLLKKAGLVEEKIFGKIRIFRFRDEDKRCQAFRHFIEEWRAT